MKTFILFIALLLSCGLFGQEPVGFLLEEMPADSVSANSVHLHTSLKPAIRYRGRSLIGNRRPQGGNPTLTVVGLGDLNAAYSDSLLFRTGAGFMTELNAGKWYARIGGVGGIGSTDSVFHTRAYYLEQHGSNYVYADLRGRVAYTPNSIFHFQAGLDNQFIGEGNRSLFLSDYGAPNPFAMIRTQFWRLEYTVLYQFFREHTPGQWKSKYATTHYLSVNLARWLNVGVFETVLFQPKDTLLNRGYDAEYLNPVIFFRPQEFALGSSDNVLLGLSLTARIRKHSIYTQMILDEFSLTDVKARNGWWATKFGIQAGVKGRFSNQSGDFFYRTEYNFVRPYTYAHVSETQNYAHQGSALAHPLGSNFHELLGELKWQRKKWSANAFVSYYLKGFDKDGFSYGGDIYQSYNNRPFEYGHFTGQGIGVNGFKSILSLGYRILDATQLQAFIEHHLNYTTTSNSVRYVPVIGVRSRLWNDYRNY